jgi:Golgi nucleoside diphosphatase
MFFKSTLSAGTAGLRLFNMSKPAYTNNLLSSTRQYFGSLGLLFRSPEYQARIIDGTEEGLSGWTSTNMLMRRLFSNSSPPETYGVSDLGGRQ